MSEKVISDIRKSIKEVNLIIEKFLINMNNGEIISIEGLDDKVIEINKAILKLTAADFVKLKNQFEESLEKVKELKEFLSNQLENTASKIKLIDKSSTASKRYNYAANDNT